WCGCNEMKMVFQDDIAIKEEMSVLLEESPGIEDDLDRLGSRENRNPADYRAGHEIGILGFEDPVARASHGGVIGRNGVFRKAFPNGVWERGEVPFVADTEPSGTS